MESDMNQNRENAACAVYEGKIVVSGGYKYDEIFKSVEAYDYYEKKMD